MTRAWSPTGLIPWFSKTEGNTYLALLHHPFLLKGKPTQCSRGSKKDFWHRCRGDLRQVKTYQVPITNSYPSHYIICHLPLVFLSPTSPLPFYSPSLFLFASFSLAYCLLVCWIACLSRWLKTILNCVALPIPTTMIFLALRLLLLLMLNLVKLMLLC